jgi:hypothetical protein
MRELRRGFWRWSARPWLAERQPSPPELGPKREQKREKRHDEERDLHYEKERLHDHCSPRTAERFVFFLAPRRLPPLRVDATLGLLQLAAGAAGAHGEDLGQDRERRLSWRVGADVESRGP